jgi:hypothetical protein
MKNNLRYALFMPSFYAVITFPIFHVLYLLNVFPYEEKNLEAQIICLAATIFFISSFIWNFSNYKKALEETQKNRNNVFKIISNKLKYVLLFFLVIGIIGALKYVIDFSNYFGGSWIFLLLLIEDSGQIRIAQQFTSSIGFQLTYFSWIAGTILFAEAILKNVTRWHIVSFVLIFLLNILFIDRTRPITLIFTTFLFVFFLFHEKLHAKKIKEYFRYNICFFICHICFIRRVDWKSFKRRSIW